MNPLMKIRRRVFNPCTTASPPNRSMLYTHMRSRGRAVRTRSGQVRHQSHLQVERPGRQSSRFRAPRRAGDRHRDHLRPPCPWRRAVDRGSSLPLADRCRLPRRTAERPRASSWGGPESGLVPRTPGQRRRRTCSRIANPARRSRRPYRPLVASVTEGPKVATDLVSKACDVRCLQVHPAPPARIAASLAGRWSRRTKLAPRVGPKWPTTERSRWTTVGPRPARG